MKIVVMYEDPDEQAAAENLARVLPRIGPSLANATIDASGVSIRSGASNRPVSIRTRVCSAAEEFMLNGSIVFRQESAASNVPPITSMKRSFGGKPVAIVGEQLPKDWSRCGRCGVPKFDGAYHDCDPDTVEEFQSRLPRPKVKPPQPKPPRETRDLIFPDEAE